MSGSVAKVDKNQIQKAMTAAQNQQESKIFEMAREPLDFGKADSLRYNILSWVLDEKYDRAIQELRDFIDHDSEFPNFKAKVQRLTLHAIDLVYAIKAKRNFPGLSSLTRAKQQELREKFKFHFKELQDVMRRVEKIQVDLRIEDARSTIYIIRALLVSGVALLLLAFVIDIVNGLAATTTFVAGELLDQVVKLIFDQLGI
jgi:hypothetical protein